MRYLALLVFLSFALPLAAEPEILINRLLAERLHLQAGDTVEISRTGDMKNAEQFRVAAIYEDKADPYQVPLRHSQIKMHLPDLERLTGRYDQLDLVSIQLQNNSDPRQFAARLNGEAIGFAAYSARELAVRSSRTFQVVSKFHEAIAMITMMAGATFIFALMIMRVEDQRKNLAILSVTGISRQTILKSLLLEATVFAFAASLLGTGIGYAASAAVNAYYRHFYQTTLVFAHVNSAILFRALSLSFLLGIIAGAFSWFRLRHLAVLQELGR